MQGGTINDITDTAMAIGTKAINLDGHHRRKETEQSEAKQQHEMMYIFFATVFTFSPLFSTFLPPPFFCH
jgi:hypothetical protein